MTVQKPVACLTGQPCLKHPERCTALGERNPVVPRRNPWLASSRGIAGRTASPPATPRFGGDRLGGAAAPGRAAGLSAWPAEAAQATGKWVGAVKCISTGLARPALRQAPTATFAQADGPPRSVPEVRWSARGARQSAPAPGRGSSQKLWYRATRRGSRWAAGRRQPRPQQAAGRPRERPASPGPDARQAVATDARPSAWAARS